jgi:hypothetical protein
MTRLGSSITSGFAIWNESLMTDGYTFVQPRNNFFSPTNHTDPIDRVPQQNRVVLHDDLGLNETIQL